MNTTTTTTTSDKTAQNGVNVEALLGARDALTQEPAGAQFKWRTTCNWIDGAHSRSTVHGFFGLGEEHEHRDAFTIDADHPELFAAQDNGATPVELVLSGLASCLMAGVASIAQMRGIQLRSVTAQLEGDMDVLAILGADTDARNGFSQIKVRFEVDADATDDEIKALVAQSQKRSAVFDVISNPTDIAVEAVKA